MIDWSPIIVAGAVLITALAAAVPALVVALSTRGAVGRVERATDGNLSKANNRIDSLEKEIASLRSNAAVKAAERG
jgi:CHASE1-domain containing sensor protein